MNQISPFEYVSILVSIILGLGITQLLAGIGNLLRHHRVTRLYWPHCIWIGFILFLHIQDWFITYQLINKPAWQLSEVMFVLLYPVLLYVMARIILPEKGKKHLLSLEEYYFENSGILFSLMSLSILLSILFNITLLDNTIQSQYLLIFFLLSSTYMVVSKDKSPWVHKIFAILVLLASISSILLEKDVWVIK